MKSLFCVPAIVLCLLSCTSNDESDPTLRSILDSIERSPETLIMSQPVAGSTFTVQIKPPIDSRSYLLDSGAYLLVRCIQRSGYYDYRYEIADSSSVAVHTPNDAFYVQVGIASANHFVPKYASTSVVYTQDGVFVPGAIPSIISRARSYSDALHIARYDLRRTNSSEALFMVLKGAASNRSKALEIIRIIDSCASKNPLDSEISLAAHCFIADDTEKLAHLHRYLDLVTRNGLIGFPNIFEDVMSSTGLLESLDKGSIASMLITILERGGHWRSVQTLVYGTRLDDTVGCQTMARLAQSLLASSDRLTPYQHVSLASLKFTFAEIAYAANDKVTSYALLDNIVRYSDASSKTYWRTSTDPYWILDASPWTSQAIVKQARWLFKDHNYKEALESIGRYCITTTSSIGHDANAIRTLYELRNHGDVNGYLRNLVDQIGIVRGKSILMDTVSKYFRSYSTTVPRLPSSMQSELVVVSSNSCSVCSLILKKLSKAKLNARRSLTVYNIDSRSIEYSTGPASDITHSQLQMLAHQAQGYPTLFVMRNGRVEREYKGTSFETIARLCIE